MHTLNTKLIKVACIIAASACLHACAATTQSGLGNLTIDVEEAYLSSGVVQVKPYTRSIINSTNF